MSILTAVVFDFDGTLAHLVLDFGEMKENVADLAAEAMACRPSPNSLPVLEWVEKLALDMAVDSTDKAERFRARCRDMIQTMELDAARQGELFEYTRPLFRELSCLGVPAAIITRNCERAVRTVFPDLDEYTSCLLARDHVDRVKPHPDHLLRALRLLDSPPGSSLMVGDHPMDVETGRRAGAQTCAVASGRVSLKTLRKSGPDYTAGDCREMMALLRVRGLFAAPPRNC